MLDHVEDHLAEVFAFMDAPFIQDHGGHGAVLRQPIIPKAGQKFLAGNVPDFILVRFADPLLRVIQSFA